MNFNALHPGRWFKDIPMPAEPWEAQKAATLQTLFRSMVIFSLLFLLLLPAVGANRRAALILGMVAHVTLLWVPYVLLRIRRVHAAAWSYTVSLALVAQILVSFSGGIRSPAGFNIVPVAILAGILTGRIGAVACSVFILVAELALALFNTDGAALPVLFPMSPLAAWSLLGLTLLYVLPPLILSINRLRLSLEETSRELVQHRKAREKIAYQTQLLEHAPDPLVGLDNAHIVTYWNDAAERIFGFNKKAAIGSEILCLLSTAKEPAWVQCCNQTSLTGQWQGELPFQSANGLIFFYATVRNLFDGTGQVTSRVAAFREITAAKNAEEALRQSEERLRLLTDAAPIGILLLDKANRIAFANRYVSDRIGEPTGAGVNTPGFLGVVMADMDGRVLEEHELPTQRVRQTGKPLYDVRLRGTNRAGETAILSVSVAPFPGKDESLDGLIVVFDVITEQTKLQEQYLQAQKMESVGLLAGGIAHDFNNLLLVINGYCEKILSSLSENDPLRPELANVLLAGERAADLTQRLLAVGRQQIASTQPVAINRLVQQFQSMLRGGLRDDIVLNFEHEGDDAWVLADPSQMTQVLMNLVINSQDAMPEGGRILIRTCRVSCPPGLAQNSNGTCLNCVGLDVQDTGTGMSTETLKHIFEPFFTTKERETNSGLGLSTVYGIVKQSGGWLDVESTPGVGTRFRVYLPETSAAEEATIVEKPASSQGSGTVLVVEDRDEVREFLAMSLKEAGYNVLQAPSGDEALLATSRYEGHIDILLSDMIMPGISGKELAVLLLSRRPDLKVILMSGYSNELVARRLDGSMQFEILQKPFTARKLLEKLREVQQPQGELQ